MTAKLKQVSLINEDGVVTIIPDATAIERWDSLVFVKRLNYPYRFIYGNVTQVLVREVPSK